MVPLTRERASRRAAGLIARRGAHMSSINVRTWARPHTRRLIARCARRRPLAFSATTAAQYYLSESSHLADTFHMSYICTRAPPRVRRLTRSCPPPSPIMAPQSQAKEHDDPPSGASPPVRIGWRDSSASIEMERRSIGTPRILLCGFAIGDAGLRALRMRCERFDHRVAQRKVDLPGTASRDAGGTSAVGPRCPSASLSAGSAAASAGSAAGSCTAAPVAFLV